MVKVPDIKELFSDESGAITMDWVALTSSVVVIGIGLAYMIYGGETGAVSTMVTNYNAELNVAADNLSGAVGDALPSPASAGEVGGPSPSLSLSGAVSESLSLE